MQPGPEGMINSIIQMGHLLEFQVKAYRKVIDDAQGRGLDVRGPLERAGLALFVESIGALDPEDPIMVALERKAEEEENDRELSRLLEEKARKEGGGPRL